MGLGFGLATKQVFEGCTVDPEGNILEELNTKGRSGTVPTFQGWYPAAHSY
jgi:hypothetical protein